MRRKKGAECLLHLLMGRARTGKSERVLKRIAEMGDSSQQILLVPEHASHVAEMDVCRACGDAASRHAEVLTFKLLSTRVLQVCGGSADVTLDAGGKLLTLQRALTELAPSLKVYRRASQRAAFLESLLDVMEELQAYAVVPETLAERVEDLEGESGNKLRDIALLYGVYLAKLNAPGRDAREALQKLEEHLEESGYIDGKDVFLDGFSYFTGRELRILRILLRRAKSVTVTLLGDDGDRELFSAGLRVRAQLIALARDAGVPCEEETLAPSGDSGALSHIERCFFGPACTLPGGTDAVALYEAGSAYSECEWVAAQILSLVREQGYRYRDITVTARNLESYAAALQTAFARFGIPLYYAHRSDILRSSVLTLLLGALDAATGGFEYEDVFRCLKTGLAGLTMEECDLLENYALKWEVRGGAWTRETPWSAHPDGYGADWTDEARERLAAVNALRARVQGPFAHLKEGVGGSGTAEEKVRALYDYLEEIDLPDALQAQTERLFSEGEAQRAEETAQLWTILCGVMDQFVEILGDTVLGAEEFAQLFRLVLTQYSVGTIPVTLDAVNLCEMTRNDRHTVRALFLLGANDGVLPAAETGGGVLRDEDREALEQREIFLAPHGMEQFRLEIQNLYASLAQPTEKLTLSYPVSDGAGGEKRPSFAIGRIARLLPDVKIQKEDADKAYRLTAKDAALEYAGEHIGGALWQYFEGRADAESALAAMRAASRTTRGKLSRNAVRSLYGDALRLSASQMDKARACHFAYFLRYGLRVKERTGAGFDAPQIGTFVHDVMEHTLRAAKTRGGLHTLEKAELHALVQEAIADYKARVLPDLSEKSARFRYLFDRLCDSTQRIMDEVADELKHSDFEPMAFELAFGPGGQMPAITVREKGNTARVVGKVDRVDGWEHGGKLYLRVVDYKTGRKSFDLAEVRYGLGLQMLLYLFALEQAGGALFGGKEIVPAGVLYTPAREPMLRCARDTAPEKIEKARKKELRRSGMVLEEPAVLQAMEHSALEEPSYLPIAVKKDGTVTGNLASEGQFEKLARYVDRVLREIADEVFSGNIDADPYARTPQQSACTYCEFASACHFEEGSGSDRMEYIKATKNDEFWQHIDEVNGEGARENG